MMLCNSGDVRLTVVGIAFGRWLKPFADVCEVAECLCAISMAASNLAREQGMSPAY
jgi:hypothetical protein